MDYAFVQSTARIALYDDMLSSPRIIEVPPAETRDFIGALSAEIYNQSREMGGGIPFSAIKQVAENFIHADFREIVVSILDAGNTIRFADQGPGIADKHRAQMPGFSSATEPMKQYIDGVGSGLPIVREYLDIKNGTLTLDDNLNGGSVITLSLVPDTARSKAVSSSLAERSYEHQVDGDGAAVELAGSDPNGTMQSASTMPGDQKMKVGYPIDIVISSLSPRGREIISLFKSQDLLGVQEVANLTDIPLSSTHAELRKLEEAGLIEKLGRKRMLTGLGHEIAKAL